MRTAKLMASIAALLALAVFLLLCADRAYSYLPTLASPTTPVRWNLSGFAVQYNINPSAGSNISGGRPVTAVVEAGFNTWTAAPNTGVAVGRGPDSNLTSAPEAPSPTNLICFVCSGDFTDAGTLAVTIFTYATSAGQSDGRGGTTAFAGQMLNASVLFNPSKPFTTDPAAANGDTTDLQTVATHEFGHFLGLDHSAVVNAVMFPFSPSVRQSLACDDVAGISRLYPGNQSVGTGAIQGRVLFPSGGGVFGAHVFADSTTGDLGYGSSVRKGPIGAMTDASGNYTINGLPPDSYTVTAEPLDGPAKNSDLSDYPKIFGKPSVDAGFTTRQH
ncbi:MAG: matrixin family metalloprotease [Terriglobales bacterium]